MAAAASTALDRLLVLVAVLAAAAAAAYPAAAAPSGKRYRVGGTDGWHVPPPEDKELYYDRWASHINFYVDDSIEFVYKNDSVIKVSKAGYYHCNETAGIGAGPGVPRDGRTLFLLDEPGYAYFASADLDHCHKGERLMVNVLAAEPPAPAPTSSLPAAPAQAPPYSPLRPSLSPVPAPSTDYMTGAGSAFAAPPSALAVAAAATLAMAGLV